MEHTIQKGQHSDYCGILRMSTPFHGAHAKVYYHGVRVMEETIQKGQHDVFYVLLWHSMYTSFFHTVTHMAIICEINCSATLCGYSQTSKSSCMWMVRHLCPLGSFVRPFLTFPHCLPLNHSGNIEVRYVLFMECVALKTKRLYPTCGS